MIVTVTEASNRKSEGERNSRFLVVLVLLLSFGGKKQQKKRQRNKTQNAIEIQELSWKAIESERRVRASQ